MYAKGGVGVISFPFSDLVNAKKRPMLVLAERGDAITSNPESDGVLIEGYEPEVFLWKVRLNIGRFIHF